MREPTKEEIAAFDPAEAYANLRRNPGGYWLTGVWLGVLLVCLLSGAALYFPVQIALTVAAFGVAYWWKVYFDALAECWELAQRRKAK